MLDSFSKPKRLRMNMHDRSHDSSCTKVSGLFCLTLLQVLGDLISTPPLGPIGRKSTADVTHRRNAV